MNSSTTIAKEKSETDPLLVTATAVVDEETPHDEEFHDPHDHHQDDNGTTTKFEKNLSLSYGTRLGHVLQASFQLGLTAFGDTTLQVALIEDVVVEKQQWVDYDVFAELFGLAQALPGSVATQVLLASAMCHAGPFGAFVALVAWIVPGAMLLTVIGVIVEDYLDTDRLMVWLAGVAPATVALVMYASANFAKHLDPLGFALATASCFVTLLLDGDLNIANHDTKYAFPLMMMTGGIVAMIDATVGLRVGNYPMVSNTPDSTDIITSRIQLPVWAGLMILQLWLIILLIAIVLANVVFPDNDYVFLFSRLFRMGSVVYGGEESVLPMLTTEFVPEWITKNDFAHGLALTQATPGSIFNLAAYMGAIKEGKILMSLTAVASIYVPSYLFLLAGLPLWSRLRKVLAFKALLQGVNAVAIGFMGAICIFLWEGSIQRASDAMILVVCLGLVSYYQVAAPAVIATAIGLGIVLNEEVLNVAQKPYNTDSDNSGGY